MVQVADAKNLRRALLLTLQLAELERPMVLVLNMLDELEERGGKINTKRLSEPYRDLRLVLQKGRIEQLNRSSGK